LSFEALERSASTPWSLFRPAGQLIDVAGEFADAFHLVQIDRGIDSLRNDRFRFLQIFRERLPKLGLLQVGIQRSDSIEEVVH
jgi:hypothetical protein